MGYVYTYADLQKLYHENGYEHLIEDFKGPTNEQLSKIQGRLALIKPDWYKSYYWDGNRLFPWVGTNPITTFSTEMKPQLDSHLFVRWPDKRRPNKAYYEWPKYTWDGASRDLFFTSRLTVSNKTALDVLINQYCYYRFHSYNQDDRNKVPDFHDPNQCMPVKMTSPSGTGYYLRIRGGMLLRYGFEGTLKPTKEAKDK